MARPHLMATVHPAERLVGEAPAIVALRAQIRHLATFDTLGNPSVPTVLLHGETGTGKGLMARLLHDTGPRARGPFLEVNCAAIPETLLEAELFGFEAGAFTDAKRAKPGLLEAASGGTLFLDEIDSLPLALQGKLLTVIEAKRVRRLGAVVDHPMDVKLTVATQADLQARIGEGRFRADLYHRLAVVLLTVPPLRVRGADMVLLAQHYLQLAAEAHRLRPKRLSPLAEAWLQRYAWPGNVRELAHLMERVTLLSQDTLIGPDILEQLCLRPSPPAAVAATRPAEEDAELGDEAVRIQQVLLRTAGNVARAARLLGMSRGALRHRMARYGIAPPNREDQPVVSSPSRGEGQGGGAEPAAFPPPSQPSPTEGEGVPGWEQKPVAVLAVEVTWPEAAGPEAPRYERWTVAAHWEWAIIEKVHGFGGVVLQRLPSLLMAAFGIPQTQEQLPQRAVQTALALQTLILEGADRTPCPELRQVVHWGQLLMDVGASHPTARLLPMGEALALPVRLLGHAAAGEILVSSEVRRLVEGWCECQPHAAPPGIEAHVVQRLKPQPSPLRMHSQRPLSRFVGRAREQAVLADLLAQVQGGWGQVVGIVGEPGIGKSRLLYEIHQHLMAQGSSWREGQCLAYGQAIPYLPVLELLRQHCGIGEADTPEAVAAKVQLALQTVGIDATERAPYLLQLMGVEAGSDRVAGLSPEARKTRTFETLRQLYLGSSQQRPLVLTVENLHWIDPSSEAFLAALIEHLWGARLLLLMTYRPGHRLPWIDKSYATQMALQPLSAQESREMLASVLQMDALPEFLVQQILAKGQGNPFFLEEIVQTLMAQGVLARAADGQRAVAAPMPPGSLPEMAIPATVQGVLASRLDRLPPEEKGLLQSLAVVGSGVTFRLLVRVVEQPEAVLHRRLSHLCALEFLCERPAGPESTYTFKHVLTQDVAYASLLAERRRMVHERTAQAIEALYAHRLEDHYGELAHHYRHTDNTEKAVFYCQRAGERAIQRSANPEAVRHLTEGLALLATLPETPARAQQELDCLIALGPALGATRGHAAPEVEQTYARARALCAQVGETPQLVPALWGLCWFYRNRGMLRTARELGEQLYRLAARREASLTSRLEAHVALGTTLLGLGEYAAARTHLDQGIALIDLAAQRATALRNSVPHGATCLAYAANTLWCLGSPGQAVGRCQEAQALARKLARPEGLAVSRQWTAFLHYRRREAAAVQAQGEALLDLATAQGFPLWRGFGTCWRGWALAVQGHGEAGVAQLREGMAALLATGEVAAQPLCLVLLAEVMGQVGQIEEGLRLLADAQTAFEASGWGDMLSEVYRLRGALLLRQSAPDVEQAETCFQQALDVARRQQAKSWELRAAMSLARLWQQQGKPAGAYELLAPIYGWFTEGFDTADLQEARALLEALSGYLQHMRPRGG